MPTSYVFKFLNAHLIGSILLTKASEVYILSVPSYFQIYNAIVQGNK